MTDNKPKLPTNNGNSNNNPPTPPTPPTPTDPSSGGGGGGGNLRAYFTDRNGKRHYARDYGHKAWPIGGRS